MVMLVTICGTLRVMVSVGRLSPAPVNDEWYNEVRLPSLALAGGSPEVDEDAEKDSEAAAIRMEFDPKSHTSAIFKSGKVSPTCGIFGWAIVTDETIIPLEGWANESEGQIENTANNNTNLNPSLLFKFHCL